MKSITHRAQSIAAISIVIGLAGATAPAVAARYVGTFDPLYGAPFISPPVYWEGTIDVSANNACTVSGMQFNSPACNFIVNSATVTFRDGSPGGSVLQTLSFTSGGLIEKMKFGPAASLLEVYTFPFDPLQSGPNVPALQYGGQQAWFSLVFLGATAQLYWFESNPGGYFEPPINPAPYASCASSSGGTFGNAQDCGWSNAVAGGSTGAAIIFAPVPEPEAYGMALAGSLIVGASLLRRRRAAGRA